MPAEGLYCPEETVVRGGARARLGRALADAEAMADLDEKNVRQLAERCAPTPVRKVPRFERDVYDLGALWELAGGLVIP